MWVTGPEVTCYANESNTLCGWGFGVLVRLLLTLKMWFRINMKSAVTQRSDNPFIKEVSNRFITGASDTSVCIFFSAIVSPGSLQDKLMGSG